MRIYTKKLTEGDRLELGRLLLKAGYRVWLGKEKSGNTSVPYLEAEPIKSAAPGAADPKAAKENEPPSL